MVCIKIKHKSLENSYRIQHLRKVTQSFFSLVYKGCYISKKEEIDDLSIIELSIRPIKNINRVYREMENKIGQSWFTDWDLILLNQEKIEEAF